MGCLDLRKGSVAHVGLFAGPVLYLNVIGARNLAAFVLESICECSWQLLSRALARAKTGEGSGGQGQRPHALLCILVTGSVEKTTPGSKYCVFSEVNPSHSGMSRESEGVSVLYAFIFTYSCGKYLFRSYQPPRIVMKQPRRLTRSIRLVILRQHTIELKSGRILGGRWHHG